MLPSLKHCDMCCICMWSTITVYRRAMHCVQNFKKRKNLVIYNIQPPKLSRVSASLSNTVATAHGIMRLDPQIRAAVELVERG